MARITQARWTEVDFDTMAWHDARVWALGFLAEKYEFLVGSVQFRSAGFKQYLRAPAVLRSTQYVPLAERGGLSFARPDVEVPAD